MLHSLHRNKLGHFWDIGKDLEQTKEIWMNSLPSLLLLARYLAYGRWPRTFFRWNQNISSSQLVLDDNFAFQQSCGPLYYFAEPLFPQQFESTKKKFGIIFSKEDLTIRVAQSYEEPTLVKILPPELSMPQREKIRDMNYIVTHTCHKSQNLPWLLRFICMHVVLAYVPSPSRRLPTFFIFKNIEELADRRALAQRKIKTNGAPISSLLHQWDK